MAPLVIVCGPPASGKTTLADTIAKHLGLPVIAKDFVKERLADQVGKAPNLGAAAFAVQFAIARELLESGSGLVLEGAFFRDQTEIVDIAALGETVVVKVECNLDVLESRYVERLEKRHPAHRGHEALPDLRDRVRGGDYGVPDLDRPTLRVNTTDGLEPPEAEVLAWIRDQLKPSLILDRDEPADPIDLKAAWEKQAEEWTRWARTPNHDSYWRFGRDAFMKLVPASARLVLDVGSGEGRLSRDLTAMGHRVVSIDASRSLVRHAHSAAPEIPAIVADAAALPLVDGCCDLVVAYMSLHDVDEMERAVMETSRVLEPGGHLCMAVVHPINSAGGFARLEEDSPFVIEGSYLESHPYVDRVEREGLRMTFSSRHHSLQTYFGAIEAAGFLVESVREIPVDAESAAASQHRERWRRLPLFLHVRAVKPKH